ncbi:hypothetical protein EB796_001447 [Bugula neritina]|uniref:Uncharacterized protein n=1 Tax=Bugula neritina TaxID=10212 RepID=A0A7J7KQ92_BUGNE|nr:hypothetical protein EB796_001447 [Bugula neritina]
MSHNPTYDPELDYSEDHTAHYYEGDRSGRSTPRQYTNYPLGDQYNSSSMASYRQATTGPPQSDTAGNGKSYRYATEATIPEDEDEADHGQVADSRQVQFSERGPSSSIASKKFGDEESSGSSLKFKILIVVAILLAVLWVIFMALYIREMTTNKSSESTTPSRPNSGAAVDGSDNSQVSIN